MKKQKVFICLLATVLILVTATVPAYAEPMETDIVTTDIPVYVDSVQSDIITSDIAEWLRWEAISFIAHGVDISSSGLAEVDISVLAWDMSYKLYVTATLQKLNGITFEDYQSWTSSGTGYATLNKSLYVGRGTYQVKTVVSVYTSSGKFVEDVTVYSSTKTY